MNRVLLGAISILASLLAAASAPAAFFFNIVADTNTPIPGGTGTFVGFNPPVIDGNDIAFLGGGPSPQQGMYGYVNGALVMFADRNTPVPGGAGLFFSFRESYGFDQGIVAFEAAEENVPSGVYAADANGVRLVANSMTPAPQGGGTIGGAGGAVIDGDTIVFEAQNGDTGLRGIYAEIGGVLQKIVDNTDQIPGHAETFVPNEPAIAGDAIVFVSGRVQPFVGLYKYTPGGIETIADSFTPIPSGVGNFQMFTESSAIDQDVSFLALGAGGQVGVYTNIGGALTALADTDTLVPGTSEPFGAFGYSSIDGNRVAFSGGPEIGRFGMYIASPGGLIEVIGPGDQIAGRTVVSAFSQGRFFRDGRLAFSVRFDDGSQAMVIAIPEPASAYLAWLMAAAVCIRATSARRLFLSRRRTA